MNEYLTSPVTPIAAAIVAVAGFTAIIIKIASNRRKEQARQETKAMEERVAKRLAAETAGRHRATRRRPSVPAPSRPGFRTDAPSSTRAPYNDGYDAAAMGVLAFGMADWGSNDDSGSRSHDPSPSPSYDPSPSPSPSYDSGSNNSSSDSGGWSSDSGGSGSF